MNGRSFTKVKKFLENDELLKYAPSIFTVAPKNDVSEQYVLVRTIDVIDAIRDSGWYPVSVQEQGTRKAKNFGYQKHLIKFTRPNDLKNNDYQVQIVLFNSHNRTAAFQLKVGIFRVVCLNGMIVGEQFLQYKQRHIGFDFDELYHQVQSIQNMTNRLTDRIHDWNTIELSRTEQRLYANNAISSVYEIDNVLEPYIMPENVLQPRRHEDAIRRPTLWTTYNIVQESMTKGKVPTLNRTKRGKFTTTREIRNIDKDIKTNQKLWDVTEEMYRLAA